MSDARAQQAREHHRLASEADAQAHQHRELRDRLIRELRASAPGEWSYSRLAAAVGCSAELIAHIVKASPPPH